jgi:hypothetical protein
MTPHFIIPNDGVRQSWRMNTYFAGAAEKRKVTKLIVHRGSRDSEAKRLK